MGGTREDIEVRIGAVDDYSRLVKQFERDVDTSVAKAEKRFKGLEGAWIASAAKITASLYALKKTFDLAFDAAQFQQKEKAFANLAASHGASSTRIIEDLRRVSAQTIETAELMRIAGQAMILGIPADKLSEMMEIARASSRITGESIQKSFEDIATGVGRQSKLILDNLGIVVDLNKAYKDYAGTLNKTANQLTDTEKKQAFLNAVLESGEDIIKRVGSKATTSAEEFERFSANLSDLKVAMGEGLLKAIDPLIFKLNNLMDAARGVNKQLTKLEKLAAAQGVLVSPEAIRDIERQKAERADERMRQEAEIKAHFAKLRAEAEAAAKKELATIETNYISNLQHRVTTIARRQMEAGDLSDVLLSPWLRVIAHLHPIQERIREETEKAITEYMGSIKMRTSENVENFLKMYDDAIDKIRHRSSKAGKAMLDELDRLERKRPHLMVPGGNLPSEVSETGRMARNLDAYEQYYDRRIELLKKLGLVEEAEAEKRYKRMSMEAQMLNLQTASYMSAARMMTDALQAASVASNSKNKEIFMAYKAFAVGTAVMQAYLGFTKILGDPKIPFPLDVILAGSHLALGLAQAAAISSQKMTGSVGSASSAPGGTTIATGQPAPAGSLPEPLSTGGEEKPVQHVTININNPIGSEDWNAIVTEQIVPALNEALDNNVELRIESS